MSNKTIAKFLEFVILITAVSGFFTGCGFVNSTPPKTRPDARYDRPQVTGKIKSRDVTEASGIAASRCQNDVLWTHNDSGDGPYIFALNSKGDNLGTWKVPNAQNIDWEDIAAVKDTAGQCYVYIGEIGDNKAKRHEHTVYRIREPIAGPATAGKTRDDAVPTENAQSVQFSYPDIDQDAETLIVHPVSGDIYVITKRISGPAGIYRIKPRFDLPTVQKAEKIGELSVPAIPNGFLTGGDISPDGRRVIICDYTRAYEYLLPETSSDFDDIWKQTAEPVELGDRSTGEAVCYSGDGLTIIATSEGKSAPVIEAKRR